jgi:hypothetical protein
LNIADKILALITPEKLFVLSHSGINLSMGYSNGSAESGYVLAALRRMLKDGYLQNNLGDNGNFFEITGTTFPFKNSGGYQTLVGREKAKNEYNASIEKLGLKSTQSVIDTNKSIQTLNKETGIFYNKQRRYNNVQICLTIAILLSSAVYTAVSIISYNESKHNKTEDQRLEQLENKLQSHTKQDSVFQIIVKDSLKMK